jgi:hypothetical protein
MFNYLFIDSARVGNEFDALMAQQGERRCMFFVESDSDLESVSPFLYFDILESGIVYYFHESGWGNSWGYLLYSSSDIDVIYRHFRKLLKVKTDFGQELYFRYYDPRVLRIFLPTCSESQIIEFFGPVERFIVEDEDKDWAIVFSQKNGVLKKEVIPAEEVFSKNTI